MKYRGFSSFIAFAAVLVLMLSPLFSTVNLIGYAVPFAGSVVFGSFFAALLLFLALYATQYLLLRRSPPDIIGRLRRRCGAVVLVLAGITFVYGMYTAANGKDYYASKLFISGFFTSLGGIAFQFFAVYALAGLLLYTLCLLLLERRAKRIGRKRGDDGDAI